MGYKLHRYQYYISKSEKKLNAQLNFKRLITSVIAFNSFQHTSQVFLSSSYFHNRRLKCYFLYDVIIREKPCV